MENKSRILFSIRQKQAVYKYCLERKEISPELEKYNIFGNAAKQR
jgi:hypothetical protein